MTNRETKNDSQFLPDRLTEQGTSLKRLGFGLWYLRNRQLFLKIIIFTLLVISVVGWAYSFYGFGRYFIYDRQKDQQLLVEMAQTGVNLLAGRTNQPLSAGDVQILSGGKGHLVAKVYNPNERTAVSFKYSFVVNDQIVFQRDGFVLPNQNKYLLALDQEVNPGTKVGLQVDQATWQRIDPREIPNWSSFLADHDQLYIIDQQTSLAGQQGQVVSQVKFRLENHSAYGYWSVPIVMLAYRGASLVDANELVLTKVGAGETREVNFSWPGLERVDRLEIEPLVNYLDQDNYLPIGR